MMKDTETNSSALKMKLEAQNAKKIRALSLGLCRNRETIPSTTEYLKQI